MDNLGKICAKFLVSKLTAHHAPYKRTLDGIVLIAGLVSCVCVPYLIAFWGFTEDAAIADLRHMELSIDMFFVLTLALDSMNRAELVKQQQGINQSGASFTEITRVKKLSRSPKLNQRSMIRVKTYGKDLGKDHDEDKPLAKEEINEAVAQIGCTRKILAILSCMPYQYLQMLDVSLHTRLWLALLSVLKLYRAVLCAGRFFHLAHWLKMHTSVVVLDLVSVLALLILFGHYTACTFFLVGALENSEDSWIYSFMPPTCEPGKYDTCPPLPLIYLDCFYWSMCTMLSSESQMEMVPITAMDKLFVLLIVVCGAFLGAVVFGAVFEVCDTWQHPQRCLYLIPRHYTPPGHLYFILLQFHRPTMKCAPISGDGQHSSFLWRSSCAGIRSRPRRSSGCGSSRNCTGCGRKNLTCRTCWTRYPSRFAWTSR
jgi:hypothetical protein